MEKIGPQITGLEILSESLNTLPKELSSLSKLHSLSLHCPNLANFSDWILDLKHLHILKLKNTPIKKLPTKAPKSSWRFLQLSGCDLEELPKWLSLLRNMTDLDLSQNKLSKIPDDIGNLHQLVRLNLDSNQLTRLPATLDHLPHLNHLSLDRNPLEKQEKERLKQVFGIWFN